MDGTVKVVYEKTDDVRQRDSEKEREKAGQEHQKVTHQQANSVCCLSSHMYISAHTATHWYGGDKHLKANQNIQMFSSIQSHVTHTLFQSPT